MAGPLEGGGAPKRTSPVRPSAPKKPTFTPPRPAKAPPKRDRKVTVKGVTFTVKPDGTILAPNGRPLPKGTTLKTGTARDNREREVIGFNVPGNRKVEIKNGTVTVVSGGPTRTDKANDFVTGEKTNKKPTRTVVSGPTKPGRDADDTRQPVRGSAPRPPSQADPIINDMLGAGGKPTNTKPLAPKGPATAAPASGGGNREQVMQLQRELNAKGAGLVVDGIYGPKTRAAEQKYNGGGSGGAGTGGGTSAPVTPAGPSGGGAVGGGGGGGAAAPVSAPSGAAPAGGAPATAKGTDAMVRQMFGDVAAFLSDPELGPILRKAATEGWDNSRLFGALQQTRFWKTKADSERKWIILNRLDNATARRQVEQQAQGIWDLVRQSGLQLSGLQVHDLAVNALKFGWSGAELREQAFNAVNGKPGSLNTAVATQYGYLAAFLDNPEVGPLLERAAREGWNQARLEAELQKTNFWKTTSDAQRRYNAMAEQTPGEAQQMVSSRTSELLTLAQSLGVQVAPDKLRQIAEDSLRFGWNQSQTRAAITAEFDYQGGESGLAGQSSRQIKQMAGQYLVPMSDDVIEKWTEQIVAGTADIEGFNAYLVEQAKSLFPGMAAALDKGITVAQYADPYRQIAARELEMNPESVDLNDPRFRKMLDQVNSKGERVSMTLSESAEYLRRLPEWQQTRGANEKAAALTENILKTFGAVAP